MSKISKRLKISDNGLRKICRRMNIPFPNAGHWQRKKYHKKVQQRRLPKNFEGDDTYTFEIRALSRKPGETSYSKAKQIENDPTLPTIVPDNFIKPHKLVVETRKVLREKKGKSYSRYPGIIETGSGYLRTSVTSKTVTRAMKFYNAIIKLIEARGYKVVIDGSETNVIVKGIEISLYLREPFKAKIIKGEYYDRREYKPTGLLSFRIESRYLYSHQWTDGAKPIEEKLATLLVKMEEIADRRIKEEIEWEKSRRIQETKERITAERRKRHADELQKVKNIFADSNKWHQAQIIRNYALTVKENAIRSDQYTTGVKEWVEWAYDKADWYDPLIPKIDKVLLNQDKIELSKHLIKNF